MSDQHPKSPGGIYMVREPEHLGPIPERTELTAVVPPTGREIGFFVYEVRGTDIYPFPDGHLTMFETLEELESYCTDDKLLTTREALKPGMKLLVQDLIGWGMGMVTLNPQGQPRVMSQNGKLLYLTDFVDDRPAAADGTPAPPRWVCIGSVNLAGLQRLQIQR